MSRNGLSRKRLVYASKGKNNAVQDEGMINVCNIHSTELYLLHLAEERRIKREQLGRWEFRRRKNCRCFLGPTHLGDLSFAHRYTRFNLIDTSLFVRYSPFNSVEDVVDCARQSFQCIKSIAHRFFRIEIIIDDWNPVRLQYLSHYS